MKRTAYQYAILRFMPYVEAGEFANVGIVMTSTQDGFFAYQLQEKRYSRLTRFFKDLEGRTYLSAIRGMQQELERLQELTHQYRDDGRHLFEELIRPRETIFRFSEPSLVLTSTPQEQLQTLYGHYVEHDFVTPEYQKTVLEKRVQNLLTEAHLADRYKKVRLGDEQYHVTLPFVEKKQDQLLKAIKPLDLRHKETVKILEKAGSWQFRLHELQRRNQLPEHMLFAVDGPDEEDSLQYEAYASALMLLRQVADVLPIAHKQAVLDFARQ